MKPKYNFFKNSKFAFEGLAAMLKNEAAFRFELCIILPLALVSLFLPVSATQHALLIAVFGLVLICECLNTAVEAVVDLVSPGLHPNLIGGLKSKLRRQTPKIRRLASRARKIYKKYG